MTLAQAKLDKLLQLFSSSEDEDLDELSDENEKHLEKNLEIIAESDSKNELGPKDNEIFHLQINDTNDDEIKVVELEVKPITIDDSDNEKNYIENFENDMSYLYEDSNSQQTTNTKKLQKRKSEPSDSDSDNFLRVKRRGRRKQDSVGKPARTRQNRPKIGRNIACKQCNVKSKNEQLFIFHMQTHEGRMETECVVCNKDFETILGLQKHYASFDKLKSDEHFIKLRPFTCHLCDLRYKSRNYLQDHLDIHAGQKKFLCPLCGKQFFKRLSLKVHLRYHEKSYHSCERCKLDLQFRNPKEYHAHLRIVHGENAFKCPICDREFSRKYDMMKHKDTHSREPNCCLQCNVNFEFRRDFNQHMKEVHNRVKQFTCTICGKVFLMHCKLTRHLETHNKVKDNCNICLKEFRNRRDYSAHMRNMHGIISEFSKSEATKKQNLAKT